MTVWLEYGILLMGLEKHGFLESRSKQDGTKLASFQILTTIRLVIGQVPPFFKRLNRMILLVILGFKEVQWLTLDIL